MDRVKVRIGQGEATALVPNLIGIMDPAPVYGVSDPRQEIDRSIQNPIGSRPLRELAAGRKNAAIVINDATRPYPGGLMVELIARELNEAGLDDSRICLVVAYGHHRKNTPEELSATFGMELLNRFEIVHHDCEDPNSLQSIGTTEGGLRLTINKRFADADLKITTGCIAPHQLAGFSGGRKSIVPGISSAETIHDYHSYPLRPRSLSMGILEGNLSHVESTKAARMAGVDFIVNAVENQNRELVACVSGDLEQAYLAGVEISRQIWSVELKERPQVAIVSPGGYPRDFDLHQSQKALACAEMVLPRGGGIILCAGCADGAGRPGQLLKEANSPDELIRRFETTGFTPKGEGKAFSLARAVKNYRVILAGSAIGWEEARQMFMDSVPTLQKAVDTMSALYGADARFLVIPNASEVIPIWCEN